MIYYLHHIFFTIIVLLLLCNTNTAWILTSPCWSRRNASSFLVVLPSAATPQPEETTNGDYIYPTASLSKPMGLLMEEVEKGAACGVMVADMTGAVAKASQLDMADVCIGDELIEIENKPCTDLTFDQVMTRLANSLDPIALTFRRPTSHVAVRFAETGVAISCLPGTPLKRLSQQARAKNIQYSCSQGDCTTCESYLMSDKGSRFVRPCVARVPKGSYRITITNSDSFLFGMPPPGF